MKRAPLSRLRARPDARRPALDYPMLIARLNAAQAGSMVLCAGPSEADPCPSEGYAFMELIEGGPAWRRAILGQAGSFNREVAERDLALSPGA